jgi:hypothetical protein
MRRVESSGVPLKVLQWRARLPRTALVAACVVLCLVGLKSLLRGPAAAGRAAVVAGPVSSAEVTGLAESFARAYLGTADGPAREAVLRRFGLVDDGLPVDELGEAPRRVEWSAVVATERDGRNRVVVTVAADDGAGEPWYLAVTVGRDAAGRLLIAGRPAVVGAPSTSPRPMSAPELEVEDPALRTVAARVVRHYVAADGDDLSADLTTPRPAVSLPTVRLRVVDVLATTWVRRGSRVAVTAVARGPRGVRLTLRYELSVARVAGRWLVREIHVNPLHREVNP